MKLRNKKTGEILETVRSAMMFKEKFRIYDEDTDKYYTYNSLAELNAEWEDYEEPKEYWYIDTTEGSIVEHTCEYFELTDKERKETGNYFETKEEAEKAVEKLEAWKRLKDKGVEFYGWRKNHTGTYDFLARWRGVPPKIHEIKSDLDLLFGDEE